MCVTTASNTDSIYPKAPYTLIRLNLKTHKMFFVHTNPVAKTDKMFSVHTETLPRTQKRFNTCHVNFSKVPFSPVHTNAFPNVSTLESVFKKFRFRCSKTSFQCGRKAKPDKKSCVFEFIRISVEGALRPFIGRIHVISLRPCSDLEPGPGY